MSDTKGPTPATGDDDKFTWHHEDVEIIYPGDPRYVVVDDDTTDDTTDRSTKP